MSAYRSRLLLTAVVAVPTLAWAACGGDDGGPSDPAQTGSIQVTATTTGDDLDADGYSVAMDGGASRNIASNGSTTLTSVAAGQHQVTLSGVAANCAVTGDNPATASVTGGATASVSFQVVCTALTGFIQVSTSTAGEDLDPDGYTAMLDGDADRSIGLNGVTTFSDVAAGQHQVELTGIASNCSVDGSNPASAAVTSGETAQVSFDVTCEPLPVGSLEVTTTVTNNFDPDGYQVFVAGVYRDRVEVDGSLVLDDLPAGVQEVELREIAPNCQVDGDNPASVDIPVGGTGAHAFSVTCTSPPDGRIVYYGALAGTYGYIVMNTDGSGKILVFECIDRQCREPQWSPDGSKIAFAMGGEGYFGPESIYTINQDGSGLFRVTSSGFDRHPAWSPDGSKILFDHTTILAGNVPRSLYVVNADGTGLTEIPRDNPMFREENAGWSPDGTQVVFSAMAQDRKEPGIYVMDAAGGAATKISEDPPTCDDLYPDDPGNPLWRDNFVRGRLEWSPDGASILFVRSYYCEDLRGDELRVMNPDGSDVVLLVARAPGVPGVSGGETLMHPSWSPDGSKIVFDAGDWTIHVVNADGTGDVAIISGGNVTAVSPDWGP